VHFDFRLSNVLAYQQGLKIIDLEFVGIGDPRWDVGSLVAAILEEWLLSAPLGGQAGYRHHLDKARFDKQSTRDAIHNALQGYWSYENAPAMSYPDIVRFAGARLLHSAYEFAASDVEASAPVASLAALGVELLVMPEGDMSKSLGLTISAEDMEATGADRQRCS
ncbi:MAG: phosphotransferase, partial [Pseudomonadota bacterium]